MRFSIPEYPDLQIGSIYCIGRNYAKHIEEMKSERTEQPVVFLKPRSSIIFDGGTIFLPHQSKEIHHEVELVVLIGKETKNVSVTESLQCVKAIAVGLDITARDIQSEAKRSGLPWTLAKGFNTFAPIGNFIELNPGIEIHNLAIRVTVNGKVRQDGNTSNMLFPVNELVSYLSDQFTLYPGDLIFTGTPKGVSPIVDGDVIDASVGDKLSTLSVNVQS